MTGDEHWFERNVEHFEQLLLQMAKGEVAPFVGAGVSVGGRFPTWQNHLRQQGKTANIASEHIEARLASGEFETIIAKIEAKRGREVFVAEIRDVFGKSGTVPDAVCPVRVPKNASLNCGSAIGRLKDKAHGIGQFPARRRARPACPQSHPRRARAVGYLSRPKP